MITNDEAKGILVVMLMFLIGVVAVWQITPDEEHIHVLAGCAGGVLGVIACFMGIDIGRSWNQEKPKYYIIRGIECFYIYHNGAVISPAYSTHSIAYKSLKNFKKKNELSE